MDFRLTRGIAEIRAAVLLPSPATRPPQSILSDLLILGRALHRNRIRRSLILDAHAHSSQMTDLATMDY